MSTETEYKVKYYTDEAKYFDNATKNADANLHLKYKKMFAELETAIDSLKEEVEREKEELKRDRKLLKLAEKAPTIDEKALIGQKHDLKMKAKKVKRLSDTLSNRIEVLKTQFEIDYRGMKFDVEQRVISKRQIDYALDFFKSKLENGHFD